MMGVFGGLLRNPKSCNCFPKGGSGGPPGGAGGGQSVCEVGPVFFVHGHGRQRWPVGVAPGWLFPSLFV